MSDVLDLESGQPAPLDPGEARSAYLEGKVGVARDKPVKVVSPVNGKLVEVDPSQLDQVLSLGFQLPSQEASQQFDLRAAQETVLGQVGTVAMEGVNTLSLGAVDVAGSAAFGQDYAKWRSAQREANPNLATATQVATEVATAFASGGTSLLGRGAVKAGTAGFMKRALAHTPASIATRGIMKTEKVLANQLARNTIRRSVVSQSAAAAVEGAIFEAGQAASDVAIDNSEKSGKEILAAIGNAAGRGALVGGAFGGAIGLLSGSAQLAKAKRLGVKTSEDALEAVAPSDLTGFRAGAQERGIKFAAQDPTLSNKARSMVDGSDIERTPKQLWEDGSIAAGEGDSLRAEVSNRVVDESTDMLKKQDDLLHKVEVKDRTEIYRTAMLEPGGGQVADIATLKTAARDTTEQSVQLLRDSGVNVRRAPKKAKDVGRVTDLRKKQKASRKTLGETQNRLNAAEKRLRKAKSAKQTDNMQAQINVLRKQRKFAERELTKLDKALERATPKVGPGDADQVLTIVGVDKGRVPPSARSALKDMVDVLSSFEPKIAAAKSPEDLMQLYAMQNRRIGNIGAASRNPTVKGLTEAVYEQSRQTLTNQTLFGGAAKVQGEINGAWSGVYETSQVADLFASKGKGARNKAGTGQLHLPDAKKWDQIVKDAGRGINNTNEQQLYRYLDAVEKNLAVQGKYTPGVTEAEIAAATKSVGKLRESLDSAIRLKADSARYQNSLQVFQTEQGLGNAVQAEVNQGSLVTAPIAFGLGSAVGGAAGGGVLFGLGTVFANLPAIVAKGEKAVRKMNQAHTARVAGREAVDSGITNFVGAMKRGKLRASSSTMAERSRRALPRAARGVTRSEEEDRYAYAIRTVQSYSADPQTAMVNMVNRLGTMPQDTPAAAAALVATVDKGARFLASKLPPQAAAPQFGKDDEIARLEAIPVAQKLKFMRFADVVNDPVGFFEGLRDGEVTAEGVEALRTVYPDWHQQLVATVASELGQRKFSRVDQAFLSRVIGMPADRTFEGGFISNLQNNTAALTEQAAQRDNQTVSPSRASPPSRDFAEMNATRSQQIAGNAR